MVVRTDSGTSLDGTKSAYTDDQQAVRDIRKLVIDCCRQNGGGHGGSAIGMAPLAVALWKHTMRYNPENPTWFDRDRFVLSNGHAAILLYTMLHISGYSSVSMDDLKGYGSAKAVDPQTGNWKSTSCHGHPEIEVPGIEVTTGPLGQGIANAVGLAIASKNLASTYNKQGHDIIKSRIYCTTGDGCLQEGVALEALTIAGHLGLDNLTLCYDNNAVTCDGPLDWIVSEDVNARMRAIGWDVIDVFDGDTSVDDIVAALQLAKAQVNKPTFINIRTTIGYATAAAGTFKSHHGTYSDDDAAIYSDAAHAITNQTSSYFRRSVERGKDLEEEWRAAFETYAKAHPELSRELQGRMTGKLDFQKTLQSLEVPKEIQATRQWNGHVFNKLMASVPSLIAGGADLWNSNQMGDQSTRILDRDNHGGRVIRYGIREHAMASISNGVAAYSPDCIVPITATFFMFYIYAAAGVRMGAINNLKVVHVATHDSIGEGQNGPTHQPVELDSLFRAMPNMLYIRPSDAEEVIGAWMSALSAEKHSSIISLARDPCELVVPNTDRKKVLSGGYVVVEKADAQVTLVSCGSELQFAVGAAAKLGDAGIPTRVVSMPCIRLFERMTPEYQDKVLSDSPHIISVEAYVSTIWARYCTASVAMDSFGYSGLGSANFARFGIDEAGVFRKVQAHVKASEGRTSRRWTLLK